MNAILICYCYQVLELCHISKGFIRNWYTVIFSYILVKRHNHIFGLLCIHSKPSSLLASNTVSVFHGFLTHIEANVRLLSFVQYVTIL